MKQQIQTTGRCLENLLGKIKLRLIGILEEEKFIGKILQVRQGYNNNPSSPVTLYELELESKNKFRAALYDHVNELKVNDKIEIVDNFPNGCILERVPYSRKIKDGTVETGIERIYWEIITKYKKLEN